MGLLLVTLLNLLALKAAREQNITQRISPRHNEVTLNLYRHVGNSSERIRRMEDFQLPAPNKNPIKVLIHDWTDSADSPWILQMHEAMGRKKRWHVMALDWADVAAQGAGIWEAYESTDMVADRLANFTIELIRTNGVPFKWVHFIGHGLGGLVALQGAQKITERTGARISRLTGLDPTLGGLALKTSADRLKDTAKFVDVIHTNGGERGTFEPFGHVDFYPNGGRSQPGCDADANCNHNRACEYWSATMLNAQVFRAFNYKLWTHYMEGKLEKLTPQPMGIGANDCMPWGPYYLETGSGPPYVLPQSTANSAL